MEKLLSEATITPFLCWSWKTGLLIAHNIVSQSCPMWTWIILMIWLPRFPLLEDHIMILQYSMCMSGVISGVTHRSETSQDLFLHSSRFHSCSIGISCKTPADPRRVDIWPLKASIWPLFPTCVKLSHFRFPFNRRIYSYYYKSAGVITVSGLLYHANYNYYCCRDSKTSYGNL